VSIPKLVCPNFANAPLTIFDLSGSQLIIPLPEDSSDYVESAPNKIDLYNDKELFVGNPAVNRYIELLSIKWNYIAESSSLIVGCAHLDIFVHTIHQRTGLSKSPAINDRVLKKWIQFETSECYLEQREKLIEHNRFDGENYNKDYNGEDIDFDKYYIYPVSEDALTVTSKNSTPKCSFQHGIAAQPQQRYARSNLRED